MKDVQEGLHVGTIVAFLRMTDVVNDNLADPSRAVFRAQKILTICSGSDLRQVFMLGDREELFLGQVENAMQSSSVSMFLSRQLRSSGGRSDPQLVVSTRSKYVHCRHLILLITQITIPLFVRSWCVKPH